GSRTFGVIPVTELEIRKKMLAAEGDLYRGVIKQQILNLRRSGNDTKRRLTSFKAISPLLLMSLPMVSSMFAPYRRFTWKRIAALGFLGWQVYRRFGSLLKGMFRPEPEEPPPENGTTAAEEYLKKRI